MDEVRRIRVAGARPYDVRVGNGVLDELPGLLGEQVRRVAVVHPPALARRAGEIRAELDAGGFATYPLVVPEGENAKTVAVAAACWGSLGQAGFTRSDAVVGIGGGATTDLAGFVAATFLRGIAVVQVPTTLLGMVDAAVGGKTGVNTGEGKNLVGAFHEPAGVLCDLAWLGTLDRRELVSGLAEVVKCGFIADAEILSIVEAQPDRVVVAASAELRTLVERAIQVKADVVSVDLEERTSAGGALGREALNYGHTLAHAIERVENYGFRHGEAVSVGLVYAAQLARLAGRLDDQTADRHRATLGLLGLPTSYAGAGWGELRDAMRVDKKTRGDLLRFVILEAVGQPAILAGPDEALLQAAYAQIVVPPTG
ncbi:MAG: 3-dehydroquinate synthase [Nocardioidaceae bacterium]